MDNKDFAQIYLMNNSKYFPQEQIMFIKERLETMDSNKRILLEGVGFKDPNMVLIVSVVGGTLGIDRFLIGDMGMGILKLLTAGGCGILTLIDWFVISNRTKEINFNNLLQIL